MFGKIQRGNAKKNFSDFVVRSQPEYTAPLSYLKREAWFDAATGWNFRQLASKPDDKNLCSSGLPEICLGTANRFDSAPIDPLKILTSMVVLGLNSVKKA